MLLYKSALMFLAISCFMSIGYSQTVLVNESNGNLVEVDIASCTNTVLANIGSFTDLASHPDGNLYAINTSGQIYRIQGGSVVQVASFAGNQYYALTAAFDGTIYGASAAGDLISYHPESGEKVKYLNMGLGASGDLTFYDGDLYMATTNNTIHKIVPEDPSQNEEFINFSTQGVEIFGIVSTLVGCEIKTFAISGGGNSRLFEIGWEDKSFMEVCATNLSIYGGSSEYEYKGSRDLINVEDISVTNSLCDQADITINIDANGIGNEISYSLDSVQFQLSNTFTNLEFGKVDIYLKDDKGCTGRDSIILESGALDISVESWSDALCEKANGSILLSVESNAMHYSLYYNEEKLVNAKVIENLESGLYPIVAIDSDGCRDSLEVEIAGSSKPTFRKIDISNASCQDGNGTVVIDEGGQAGFSYSIDNGATQDGIFGQLSSGNYSIRIIDEMGCLADTILNVGYVSDCPIYIPNAFSPNNDGVNDIFTIFVENSVSYNFLRIFDRWGNKVYEDINGEIRGEQEFWDGRVDDSFTVSGTFTYVFQLAGENRPITLSGEINIIN